MAVTNKWYGKAFLSMANKEVDLDSDDIKVLLVTASYTFDQDTHQYLSSITNELSGGGYARVALTGEAISYDAGTNVMKFDANDAAFAGLTTTTARAAVVFDNTPASDATRPLLQFVDFGADVTVTAGTLTVTWNAAGIATVTVA